MAKTQDINQEIAKAFATIYETIQQVNSDYVARLEKFITSKEVTNYVSEKKRILKKYNLEKTERFCIFEEISDRWRYEDYLSDILKIILDPSTPKIGNIQFLRNFLKMIGVSEEEFPVDVSTLVIRERMKIDLLLHNKHNQVIIIESKLNDANPTVDQPTKYVRFVKNKGYVKDEKGIIRVVYLPRISDNYTRELENVKELIKTHSDEYADEKKLLLTSGKLVVRAGITDPNQKTHSLVSFLDDCIEVFKDEKDQTAKVIIEQYKTLLQHIGGNIYMNTPNKELLKAIYSDSEKFETAVEFAEFWNNRHQYFSQVIKDKFKENLPEPKKLNGYDLCLWNSKKGNYYIYYYPYSGTQVGFTTFEGDNFTPQQQEELKKILNNLRNASNAQTQWDKWVWCDIIDSQTFFDDILNAIKILREH